jgi:hypothetical protein
MDFVLVSSVKLHASVSLPTLNGAYPNATLNGLEIMKMNNSMGNLSSTDTLNISPVSSSKKNVGVIEAVRIGASVQVVILAQILCFQLRPETGAMLVNIALSS